MGRHAEALAVVQEGLRQSPDSTELQQAQSVIGSCLHRRSQSGEAAAAAQEQGLLREAGSPTALDAALKTLRTAGEGRNMSVV